MDSSNHIDPGPFRLFHISLYTCGHFTTLRLSAPTDLYTNMKS